MAKSKKNTFRGYAWRYAGGFQAYHRVTGELKSIYDFPLWERELILPKL